MKEKGLQCFHAQKEINKSLTSMNLNWTMADWSDTVYSHRMVKASIKWRKNV